MFQKIHVILFLIIFIFIIDIFSDQILLFFGSQNNRIAEVIFKSIRLIFEVVLIFWAFLVGKQTILQSKEREKNYKRLIDLTPEAIIVHKNGEIIYTNKAGVELFGANNVADLLHYDLNELFSLNPENLKDGQVLNYQVETKRLDNKKIHLEITSTNIEYNGLPASEILAQDITIRKRKEQMIENLVYQDTLTKLPNRRAFMKELDKLIMSSKRNNLKFAVMMIDLDGFKKVNDTFGHAAGDELLKMVSKHFRKYIRENDTVARLAGDEFTILLSNVEKQDCISMANKIIKELNFPTEKASSVTASIGIAIYPKNGEDAQTLLNEADMAMYYAKRTGKNDYSFAGSFE